MPPPPLKRSLPSWAGGEIAADAAARLPHYAHDWASGWAVGVQ
jgi:hypothetical protein